MDLHRLLDVEYGPDGDAELVRRLDAGADIERRRGEQGEAPLHVAARRRRLSAVEILLGRGAEVDARNGHGKTAWAHAKRRGFDEIAEALERRSADRSLSTADRLAVAVVEGRLTEARDLLGRFPGAARTGNPEEDRLLADVAGREAAEPVALLIAAGADLSAPGLDGGTPLHQAAWFGQPANARLLVEAGAPLEAFDPVHESSPIGWVAHGSRHSGGCAERQEVYVELTRLLLAAGARLDVPLEPEGAYLRRLLEDASPAVRGVLTGGAPA